MNTWWHRGLASQPADESRYPRNTRLELIPRLLDLGFTKEDLRIALECSDLQVIKDDLRILRQQNKIGPDLFPKDLPVRLRQTIVLCAQLEDTDGWNALLRRVLLQWMRRLAHESSSYPSLAFPTLLASSGEICPIVVRRSQQRPA
jgi:hypothetical protein